MEVSTKSLEEIRKEQRRLVGDFVVPVNRSSLTNIPKDFKESLLSDVKYDKSESAAALLSNNKSELVPVPDSWKQFKKVLII